MPEYSEGVKAVLALGEACAIGGFRHDDVSRVELLRNGIHEIKAALSLAKATRKHTLDAGAMPTIKHLTLLWRKLAEEVSKEVVDG